MYSFVDSDLKAILQLPGTSESLSVHLVILLVSLYKTYVAPPSCQQAPDPSHHLIPLWVAFVPFISSLLNVTEP